METRIEKYREYRELIKNEGELITRIANDNSLVLSYKERINKVNDKILKNIQFDNKILRLTSIDNTSKNEVSVLKRFAEIIDSAKLQTVVTEVEELIGRFKLQSILDSSGGISLEWLEQDCNYYEIKLNTDLLEKTQNDWNVFQIDSLNQINKINSLLDQENQAYKFNSHDIISPFVENKTFAFRKFYLCIALTMTAFIIAAIIILIVLLAI